MCEPISLGTAIALGSAAASVGGTMLTARSNQATVDAQTQANQQQAAASAAARTAERTRQAGYEQQASANFADHLRDFTPGNVQTQVENPITQIAQTAAKLRDTTGADAGQLTDEGGVYSPDHKRVVAAQVAEGASQAKQRLAGMARSMSLDSLPSAFGVQGNLFGASQGLLGQTANRSLQMGMTEGDIPGATIVPGYGASLGQLMTGLGNAGLGYAAMKGAFSGPAFRPEKTGVVGPLKS